MDIKILGADGCKVCSGLEQTVIDVLSELNVPAAVGKLVDVDQLVQYGVFALPGLVINDQVLVSGRVPSRAEIRNWIKEYL